jgi:hypothetical protein
MRKYLYFMALIGMYFAGPAVAATITYTASGTASGTIGANSFSNDSYSIVATGNTANTQLCQQPGSIPGCNIVLDDTMQISIDGLGTYTVSPTTIFFDNTNSGIIGFLQVSGGGNLNFFFYGVGASEFYSYDAVSAIGPLSYFAITINNAPLGSNAVDTNGGLLTFDAGSSFGTFQAVLAQGAVPEPSTWALMLLGFGMVGMAIRRRSAAAGAAVPA